MDFLVFGYMQFKHNDLVVENNQADLQCLKMEPHRYFEQSGYTWVILLICFNVFQNS